jgi:hypothetical protein
LKHVLLYLPFLFLLHGCSKDNRWACFTPTGSEKTERRSVDAFTRIETFNKIQVTIFQGTETKVEVVAGKNIIHNIKTTVKDGVLKIEDDNTCNFVRGYKHTVKVYVTLPYLEKATNNGVGQIFFDEGFSQDSISVRAESSGDIHINGTFKMIRTSSHGNGDIYLDGICNKLFVYSYGTNFLQAMDLEIKDYAFIANQSLGDCNINATQTPMLEYVISSSGNLYYRGEPGIIDGKVDQGAKGKLLRKD